MTATTEGTAEGRQLL